MSIQYIVYVRCRLRGVSRDPRTHGDLGTGPNRAWLPGCAIAVKICSYMREVDIAQLDLNLLKVFSALIEEGSATAAGERLGVAQSSVSHSLARLREALGDPLFVRSAHGLQPTPLSLGLREPIARALRDLQEALDQHQVFQPAISTRTFNLLMTDVGEMTFLPPLMARIRSLAPRIRLVTHQLPRQSYKQALESGEVDLAIGQLPHGQTDLVQQLLWMEPFDGYARVGHPILENPSMEAFLAADHLIVGRPAVSEMHMQRALGPARRKAKRGTRAAPLSSGGFRACADGFDRGTASKS